MTCEGAPPVEHAVALNESVDFEAKEKTVCTFAVNTHGLWAKERTFWVNDQDTDLVVEVFPQQG